MLTFRRCSAKDEGSYLVKARNNIGSDTMSWKILVVATEGNSLLDSCEGPPGRNTLLPKNRKNTPLTYQTTTKLDEVRRLLVFYYCM